MDSQKFQIGGLAITIIGFVLIAFLYWAEPRSFAEVATKSEVAIGTYEIDRPLFERGLASFRADQFAEARSTLERADPEKRDAATQFYIAYSFYRQGFGRFTNDDALFQSGIEAVNRVIAVDPNFRSTDASLAMKTPIELRTELEQGLKITTDDFNPFKLTRERK